MLHIVAPIIRLRAPPDDDYGAAGIAKVSQSQGDLNQFSLKYTEGQIVILVYRFAEQKLGVSAMNNIDWSSAMRLAVGFAKANSVACGTILSTAAVAGCISVAALEGSRKSEEQRKVESSHSQHLFSLLTDDDQKTISSDLLELQQRPQAANISQAKLSSCRKIYFGPMFRFQQCAEHAKQMRSDTAALCGADFLEFNSALVRARAEGCNVSSLDSL